MKCTIEFMNSKILESWTLGVYIYSKTCLNGTPPNLQNNSFHLDRVSGYQIKQKFYRGLATQTNCCFCEEKKKEKKKNRSTCAK